MRPFVGDASNSAALLSVFFWRAEAAGTVSAVSYGNGTDRLALKIPPKTDVVLQTAKMPMISDKKEDLGASAQR